MSKKRTYYRQTLKIYWRFASKYKKYLLGSFFAVPESLLLFVFTPFVLAKITELLFEGDVVNTTLVGKYLLLLLGTLIVGALCNNIYLKANGVFELKTVRDINSFVLESLMNHSYTFHGNSFAGALIAKAGRFTSSFITLADTIVLEVAGALTSIVASIIVLYLYSPKIALTMLCLTFVFILVSRALSKKRWPYRVVAVEAQSLQTAQLADTISNIITAKTFAREQHELNNYRRYVEKTRVLTQKSWSLGANNQTIIILMGAVLQFVLFSMTIVAIQNKQLEISVLIIVQAYVLKVIQILFTVGQITKRIEQVFSESQEMTEILIQDMEVNDKPEALSYRPEFGQITFKNVGFQYKENKQTKLFEDFSLDISAGEKIGLVGHSGSGKTTLTKLLLRFMDIKEGKILFDGVDITDIKQVSVRNAIAYVPQEPLMFHRSIMDNIRYGDIRATNEQVFEAARLAHATEFIDKLPKKYDTLVGERGMKLSGGQRQRVAIARAILKDAPIIVLDEATSALDSESEQLIQDALAKLMEKKTAIVIAHRLSTIQKMDRIVLLEDGKIKEIGSHTELLKQKGTYSKLWKHQSGGFLKD